MSDRGLLDTDILSEVIKDRDVRVMQRAAAHLTTWGRLTTSAITIMEIVSGLKRVGRAEDIHHFERRVTTLEVLGFGKRAALLAGRIHGDLLSSGQPLGRADPMIAAISLSEDVTLVTGNTNHYQRIQRLGYALRLDNWRLDGG